MSFDIEFRNSGTGFDVTFSRSPFDVTVRAPGDGFDVLLIDAPVTRIVRHYSRATGVISGSRVRSRTAGTLVATSVSTTGP